MRSALIAQHYLDESCFSFAVEGQADKAMAQVDDAQFFTRIDADANSIALIVKHVAATCDRDGPTSGERR